MSRPHNFNPGPSQLPLAVLERVRESLINFRNTGIGVLETSHRSEPFAEMMHKLDQNIRQLAEINDDYAIIFCPGGATQQFSMVPLNFGNPESPRKIGYLNSGIWSQKAFEEAQKFGEGIEVGSAKKDGYCRLPAVTTFSTDLSYLHFTSNNTIAGTQFPSEPTQPDGSPFPAGSLICDASSDIFSRPLDISRYALLYAGTQKNIGTAGVTLVIVKRDLASRIQSPTIPLMLDYRTYIKHGSLYNTPPVYALCILYEMIRWILEEGALPAMASRAKARAELVYEILDTVPFYKPYVSVESRSLMNITFQLRNAKGERDESIEKRFVSEATRNNIIGLAGHRLVGGARASLYNGVSIEDTLALTSFMRDFAEKL